MVFLRGLSLVEQALLISLAASGGLLVGAHAFEAAGYAPCELCLDQREAHWAALAIALPGFIAAKFLKARLAAVAAVGATALVYAVSAGLAFYHTGVEWEFWPGPATCSGIGDLGAVTVGDLSDALDDPAKGPSCVYAQWRFLGLSMAGYNMLVSAGLFVLSLAAAVRATRRERATNLQGAVHG